MAHLSRTLPCRMLEHYTVELNSGHWIVECSVDIDKSLDHRNDGVDSGWRLVVTRPIVDVACSAVAELFLRTVQQFDGIGKIIKMIGVAGLVGTQYRPRTLELDSTLRTLERD